MTEGRAKSRWRTIWRFLLFTAICAVAGLAALGWYATTDSFQRMIRRQIVAELERVTGGRVELGSFHSVPLHFQVEARNLTIHGRESAEEIPYAHVDRLIAKIKIISILNTEFGFHSVVLEHPIIHVISYPDGTTNQPRLTAEGQPGKSPVEQLFSLSINRLEVRHGELVWNDRRIPLDFIVNDLAVDMAYSFLRRRYESNLLLGKVDTRFESYRPIAWTAEAHFSLGRNGIEVKSLKASSGRSRLEASGRIEDFRQPKIEASYDTTVDVAEMSAIMRRSEARRGTVQVQGHGSWSVKDYGASGKFLAKDFDWRDSSLNLRGATVHAQYSLTPQQIAVSEIQARMLGGSVIGDAGISNWLAASKTEPNKGKKAEGQKGIIRLRMKGLAAAEIVDAYVPLRPLNQIRLAGTTSGTAEVRWNGALRNSETQVALNVAAPSQVSAGQLPLNAHAQATYRSASRELEVAEFNASTRATQVHASGKLSSATSLRVSVNTTDLAEWQPAAKAFGVTRIPVTLHGRGVFVGLVTGKLPDVTFAGNLEVENFDSLIPATSSSPERHVHWDILSADVELSQHSFVARNSKLQHGDTNINFDLRAELNHGRFTDASRFGVRLDMRRADVAEMMGLAGYDYPVTGVMNLNIRASGTRQQSRGEGSVQLTHATLYGEQVETFTSDLRLVDGDLQCNNIHLTHSDALVAGDAGWNFNSRSFHFNLQGKNFDLARMSRLQASRVAVEGRADFTAHGTGTLMEPTINASVLFRELNLGHEPIGNFALDAVSQGPDLHISGRSQFENSTLTIDGNIHLRDNWPSTLSLQFDHLDVDAVLRTYLQGQRVAGNAAASGKLVVHGPLRQPRDLEVEGNLNAFDADIQNVKIHNDGEVRFAESRQSLKIEQFHLIGADTDFTAGGTVQLTGKHELDLQVQGRVNLQLLDSFYQGVISAGVVALDMTVGGTTSQPAIQGKMHVTDGSIAYSDLPSGLSEINGTVVFNQDRMQIETLTARTGGGAVTFGGYATSYGHQLTFDLTAQGQAVRLRYPPGVSSTANFDVHFVGSSAASTLSGDVIITKLAMTPGFDFGAYLARAAQRTVIPQTNPVLNRIRLDVHVTTTPELRMQTAMVQLSGEADLHMRGTAAKPVLLGRADVIEGEVYFNGAKYHLDRGDVTFVNPVSTHPVLDLQATTRVRDYDISLNLTGEPDKLNITYRSEPPLPTADIIALLALGRTREESAQLQQSGNGFSQDASNAILAEALNATVTNRVQRLFGVSRLRIDPQGIGTETSPARGPQVTIEQRVADNFTVTFSQNVSQASQQIIQVEYNVTRNVAIVGLRDQNGVVSFDIKFRQRKK